jgi:hypothetical protein
VPYTSNTTLLTLDVPVPLTSKYATLRIKGNQGIAGDDKFNSSEVGAEVAEWGIIVDDGSTAGSVRRDLEGTIFNKDVRMGKRAGLVLDGEKVVYQRENTEIARRTAAADDEARNAVLAKYGRYMRRAAEERR